MSSFQFGQIGVIRSPYKEKFAVPRQPGLVTRGGGELHLIAPYNQADAVRGLEAFSHLWVVFVFHQTMELIGIPHTVVIGDRNLDSDEIEYKYRRSGEKQMIKTGDILDYLVKAIKG
jgi:Uncharacterized conserved protein